MERVSCCSQSGETETARGEHATLENWFRSAHPSFEQGTQEFLGQETGETVQEEMDVCIDSLARVCTVSSVFCSSSLGRLWLSGVLVVGALVLTVVCRFSSRTVLTAVCKSSNIAFSISSILEECNCFPRTGKDLSLRPWPVS